MTVNFQPVLPEIVILTSASLILLIDLWLPDDRAQVPQGDRLGVAAFWIGLAASVLIKGPIGPMVIGFTLAGLCLMRRDLAILSALRSTSKRHSHRMVLGDRKSVV